jgi:hypothetical protein
MSVLQPEDFDASFRITRLHRASRRLADNSAE